MGEVGRWGPVARGGVGRRWPRLLLVAVLGVTVAGIGATASVARLTLEAVTENIERATVDSLDEVVPDEPLHVLVVGSDGRSSLTREERNELSLGHEFDGNRSDTVLLVSVSADRSSVSMVSFPRDLVVSDPDGVGIAKLTETYGSGEDALVRAVREDLGFPVNHYVEVSILGFINTVEVVGDVQVCLDEPLRDPKIDLDLPEGCQTLDPETSLRFVRSRTGRFGDFERIERQQQFIRAMLGEILDARMLSDPGRLVTVAEEVSSNVVVDDGLSVPLMVELAQQLQGALSGGVTMVTVPGFPRSLDDEGTSKSFVVPYGPGLEVIREDVAANREPATRGTPDERDETSVELWTGGQTAAAAIVESTLAYGGFGIGGLRTGPGTPVGGTVVHPVPGFEEHAEWVASLLGASVQPLPVDAEVGEGRTVVVNIGSDAVAAAVAADAPQV